MFVSVCLIVFTIVMALLVAYRTTYISMQYGLMLVPIQTRLTIRDQFFGLVTLMKILMNLAHTKCFKRLNVELTTVKIGDKNE